MRPLQLPPPPAPSARQPNRPVPVPRPDAPPPGFWDFSADVQTKDGPWKRLRGKATAENAVKLFKADEIDFNEDTHMVEARGNVYFHNYERNEQVWADHLEYNTEEETGKFYQVRGMGQPRIDARPGILTTNNPFFFEGEWAERKGDVYILHKGYFTDCKVPRPWWRLRGSRFVIVPGDHATAYSARFVLKKFPLFFAPVFYKSLEKAPRRSGFLMPNIGNSSRRGKMIGVGYFWAINRSYDVTYRIQDFTARGFAHNIDFRGKPREGTDFDAIFYGVQDRGIKPEGVAEPIKQGGASLYIAGKSELPGGWHARGQVNYVSSLIFRQAFNDTITEALFSETHSVGYLNKDWSNNTFNIVADRLENFQSTTPGDSVLIRKLPEFRLLGRDRQFWSNLPIWFSWESSASLLRRNQPLYQTRQFTDRMDLFPHVTSAFSWHDFHFIPSFGVRATHYGESQFDGRIVGENYNRTAREFDFDIIFPSLARTFNRKSWLGEKLKHVIEPRASYRYTAGVEDFSRVIRFDDIDLMSNTNELELSVVNRLYAKRGADVREVLSWELFQKRYFDPTFGGAVVAGQRNVLWSSIELTPYAFLNGPRTTSPVVSVVRTSPFRDVGIQWRADYDQGRGGIVNSSFTADKRFAHLFIAAGHNSVHSSVLTPGANQFNGTVVWGDYNRKGLSAAFQAVYDYEVGYLSYTTTQFTYNTDCCGLSVQIRRTRLFGANINDTQTRIAFAVANIGSFGSLKKQDRLF